MMTNDITSTNPVDGTILWQGKATTTAEIDATVKRARVAFKPWALTALAQRIVLLEAFAKALQHHQEKLALTISQEVGKPLWESRTEVAAMIAKVAISIDAYNERCKETHTEMTATRHKPHGVVAVLGPFNFPGHLPNGHIVPALLAGNTVVFKPSEYAPYVTEIMMQCWKEVNLPPGTLNVIHGDASVGKTLAHHPDIDGLFFTGSFKAGLQLSKYFGGHPEKILALEMGGNNPLVIWDVKNLKAAAYITIQSAYLSAGQRCSCARRLIIRDDATGDVFLNTLTAMISEIVIGPYSSTPEPFMGPVINIAAAEHLMAMQQRLSNEGAKILIPMKQDGAFVTPALLDVTNITNKLDEECFGPLLQITRVSDFDEAIAMANDTAYGLSAGLLSDSHQQYEDFYHRVNAGIINWNTPLTGARSAAPFGGIGRSGNHRPSAYYAADYCSYPIASMECSTLTLPEAPTPGLSHHAC